MTRSSRCQLGGSSAARQASGMCWFIWEGHGYGLKNVEQVVRSHDGSLDIQEEAGRFLLTILIPLGEP